MGNMAADDPKKEATEEGKEITRRLEQVIRKSNAQKKVLRKILNELNKKGNEIDGGRKKD